MNPIKSMLFLIYNGKRNSLTANEESEEMENTYRLFLIGVLIVLLSACNYPGSDRYVQTEVAAALETAAIQDTQAALVAAQTAQAQAIRQTETASAIEMQTQTALAAYTATSTGTSTPAVTETPTPTNTPAGSGLPEGQMVVVAKGNAPWWKKKGENDVGKPIMVKTNPVQRYEDGQTFRVYDYIVAADGGGNFYQIAGPLGAGYFVLTGDVTEK